MTDALAAQQQALEAALNDLRRVIQDDMDASNEATAIFGRRLSALGDRLDAIEARLEELQAAIHPPL